MTSTLTLTARIGITLLRGQNNREHHRVRANRVAVEREATLAALAAGDWQGYPVSLRRPELGARVTLIRPFVVTPLDSDNLSAACKAPRDAVAQFLGVDDASDRLHWVYLQCPALVVGKSMKPGRSRSSPDHDTCPLVRIEVMPVERIDPQAEALAHAEARESELGLQVVAQAARLRLADAMADALRYYADREYHSSTAPDSAIQWRADQTLAAWDAVPGDVSSSGPLPRWVRPDGEPER